MEPVESLNTGSPGKSPSLCTFKIHPFHGFIAVNVFVLCLWLNMVYEYGKWLPCSAFWAYSTVCLSIRQLMDNTWMVYSLWLLWVMLLWTLILHGLNIFSVYGYIQKREIAASYGYSIFTFWGTFAIVVVPFYSNYLNNIWRFLFFTSSAALVIICHFDWVWSSMGVK